MSETGHDMREKFFSKCSSDHAEQLLPQKLPLKTKLKCLKKGLSQQITEKWQNDNYKCVIRQKRDMI